MFGFKVICCWALLFIFKLRFPPGVSSAGLTIWLKRHMPRAPRFWGPRASLFYFFLNFLFSVSARGPSSAPEWDLKEFKSPRKLGPLVFQRGAPKSPRSIENVIGPQNLKMEAPKCGAPNDFFVPCFSAGP